MLKVQLYFVLLCVFLRACSGGPCNEDWRPVPVNNGYLRYHLVPSTWRDAAMRCTNEGATLASPTSSEIIAIMRGVMADCHTNFVFVGISATLSEANYVTLDGANFANLSLSWGQGQNVYADNIADCLVMADSGDMHHQKCTNAFNYFCFKPQNAKLASIAAPSAGAGAK